MLLDKLFDRPIAKTQLQETYKNVCEKYGELSDREAKKILGVTELDIVDQQLGVSSVALKTSFLGIVNSLSSLGYTTTEVYNNVAVQECRGFYMATACEDTINIIMANAKEAGIKLLLDSWQCIYAVRKLTELGYRYSFQIFDKNGSVVQKIFMRSQSNFYAYQDIVNNYKDSFCKNTPIINKVVSNIYKEVDVRELILDWRKAKSISHAEELTKKYKLSYQEIYRYIGDVYAEELPVKKLEVIMEQVTERNMPMSFYTFNNGASQYYSGTLDSAYASGDYLYCIAADFSLKILETGIANAWLVRKATSGGIVTSLEFYDSYGSQLLKVHGQYDSHYGESIHWKRLAESTLQYCGSGYLMGANKSNPAYIASNVG